jgi:hypothetical protein
VGVCTAQGRVTGSLSRPPPSSMLFERRVRGVARTRCCAVVPTSRSTTPAGAGAARAIGSVSARTTPRVRCTRWRTGALPARRDASCRTTVTGMQPDGRSAQQQRRFHGGRSATAGIGMVLLAAGGSPLPSQLGQSLTRHRRRRCRQRSAQPSSGRPGACGNAGCRGARHASGMPWRRITGPGSPWPGWTCGRRVAADAPGLRREHRRPGSPRGSL